MLRKVWLMSLPAITLMVYLVAGGFAQDQSELVIKITAKKFEYTPNVITVKRGTQAILEFTSLDTLHRFSCPDLGIRADIFPGKVSRVRILAEKSGTYESHCDIFCGEGHEGMTGTIVVE